MLPCDVVRAVQVSHAYIVAEVLDLTLDLIDLFVEKIEIDVHFDVEVVLVAFEALYSLDETTSRLLHTPTVCAYLSHHYWKVSLNLFDPVKNARVANAILFQYVPYVGLSSVSGERLFGQNQLDHSHESDRIPLFLGQHVVLLLVDGPGGHGQRLGMGRIASINIFSIIDSGRPMIGQTSSSTEWE